MFLEAQINEALVKAERINFHRKGSPGTEMWSDGAENQRHEQTPLMRSYEETNKEVKGS